MSNSEIQISDHSLQVKEYGGQRVITFKDIDEVHERPMGYAKRNFYNNKKRFVEGEDYYIIKPSDFKSPKIEQSDSQKCKNYSLDTPNSDVQKNEFHTFEFKIPNRGLTLITESGYLMLVKSLTDDLAWTIQRQLVNNYFRVKDYLQNKFRIPQTMSEALRLAADLSDENEKLKEQEQILLPQAQGYQLIVNGKNAQSMNDFAKAMNWGRNRLYAKLRQNGIFIKESTIPYQRFCKDGYFIVRYTERNGEVYPYTLITPKGMDYIVKKVREWGIIDELLNHNRKARVAG